MFAIGWRVNNGLSIDEALVQYSMSLTQRAKMTDKRQRQTPKVGRGRVIVCFKTLKIGKDKPEGLVPLDGYSSLHEMVNTELQRRKA